MEKTKKSKEGKTLYAHFGIWREGGEIHLAIPEDSKFHSTVNNNDGSIRQHPNLYDKLDSLLKENDL